MATKAEIRGITQRFKTSQNRRAAILAAIVAAYYRRAVDFNDPRSVDRWLTLFAPRVLTEQGASAREATEFIRDLRRLEVPGATDVAYEAISPANLEQIRASLLVVGPKRMQSKAYELRGNPDLTRVERQAELQKTMDSAVTAITGSVARHVQNGGRTTIYEGQKADPEAKGYIRVTDGDPCFFCAMLTSRGPIYDEASFDQSDPRFTGPGNVKVHDSCGCTTKPVFDVKNDPFVDASREYERMWREFAAAGDSDAITNFRRGYEGRKLVLNPVD